MADATTPTVKTPWHLWLVGIVAVLWNSIGVMDFTLTQLKNETYLKDFTPAQLEYFYGFPLWSVIAWGAGVYGGFIGSLLLLFRRRFAVRVFLVSILGVILTSLYSYGLSDGVKMMGGNAVATMGFSAVIFIIAVLLWLYARAMTRRGVLR